MRILAVVPLYPPYSRVGAWLATHSYLAGATRRHDVDVVTYAKTSIGTYELDGVRVHPARHLDELPADVVVAHLGDDGTGKRVADARRVPLAYMVHGHLAASRSKLDGAALAVFNSEASLHDAGWSGPAVVAHPITDPAEHATEPGDRVTLVNLTEAKGGWLFAQLVAAMPDVKFLGVRGGYGVQVVPEGPNVRTIFTTRDMRTDVWGRTRILLMPSETEAWGMVGVEAMCSGIPVIAHPTEGLLESLAAGGVFVHRDDTAGWERQIRRLLDRDEWTAASKCARRRAAELTADIPDRIDRFVSALEQLAGVPA